MAAKAPPVTPQDYANKCRLKNTDTKGWKVTHAKDNGKGKYVLCFVSKTFSCPVEGTDGKEHTANVIATAHLHFANQDLDTGIKKGAHDRLKGKVDYAPASDPMRQVKDAAAGSGQKLSAAVYGIAGVVTSCNAEAQKTVAKGIKLSAYEDEYGDDFQSQSMFANDMAIDYLYSPHQAIRAPSVVGLGGDASGQTAVFVMAVVLVFMMGLLCAFIGCVFGGVAGFAFGSNGRSRSQRSRKRAHEYREQEDQHESV